MFQTTSTVHHFESRTVIHGFFTVLTMGVLVAHLGDDAFSMNLTTEPHLFLPHTHHFPLGLCAPCPRDGWGEQTGHWVIHPSIHSCVCMTGMGHWEDASAQPAVSIVTTVTGHEEMPMRFSFFFIIFMMQSYSNIFVKLKHLWVWFKVGLYHWPNAGIFSSTLTCY